MEDYPELARLNSLCLPLAQVLAACRHGKDITRREEKILLQTIGFLPRSNRCLHHLLGGLSEI